MPLLKYLLHGDISFRFTMPEQRVNAVNFNVWKKVQKIIGYHSNVPWDIAKLLSI